MTASEQQAEYAAAHDRKAPLVTLPLASDTTADEFNATYPVGTPVLAWPSWTGGRTLWTRTRYEAWGLGSGSAVVAVEGYPGGIALSHVMPIPQELRAAIEADVLRRVADQWDELPDGHYAQRDAALWLCAEADRIEEGAR